MYISFLIKTISFALFFAISCNTINYSEIKSGNTSHDTLLLSNVLEHYASKHPLKAKKIEISNSEIVYQNIKIKFVSFSKSSDPQDINNKGKNDYLMINDSKFMFDSLLCSKYNLDWYTSYSSAIECHSIYIIKKGNEKLLFTVINDDYGEYNPFLYLFKIDKKNKISFVDCFAYSLKGTLGIGDFDRNNTIDFMQFDGQKEKVVFYNFNDDNFILDTSIYLSIIYPPEKEYKPHIVVKESKFPPLDSLKKNR